MGVVYKARDTRLDRIVAVKVLSDRELADAESKARFEREARAISALSHPHICTLFDVGSQAGAEYLVMEYLEGETLADRLRAGPLPLQDALRYGCQIAEALEAAHRRGVIHRDLKPANVLLTASGVKLLDFGLARLESSGGADEAAPTASVLTNGGRIFGTLPYMAPEQLRGQSADARTDIWALGAVLYEMISGRRSFPGNTPAELASSILSSQPAPPSTLRADLPAFADGVVMRCLAKSPEERWQTGQDVAFALRDAAPEPGGRGLSLRKRWPLPVFLGAAVVAASAIFIVVRASSRGRAIESLAVLPFKNEAQTPDADYLSDGITDTLINRFAQLPGLRVTARSLAFRYKPGETDAREAGRKLGVQAVLTGSVLQRGDSLSIRAELMDVAAGSQLWGQQYTRRLAEILGLEDEIARDIAEKVRPRLTGEDRRRVTRRSTESAEAYQAYLKGRYHTYRYREEDVRLGIESLKKAIVLDPAYSRAWAGLAEAYLVLEIWSPPAEHAAEMRAAAKKALDLDEGLAEAHTTLGVILYAFDWDWAGSDREFQRALEIDPDYVWAHDWYGTSLALRLRGEEAIAHLRKAVELEPLVPALWFDYGDVHRMSRHYEEAAAAYRKAIELDSGFVLAHHVLGWNYIEQRNLPAALKSLQEARRLSNEPQVIAAIAYVHALSGDVKEARRLLGELESSARTSYVPPYNLAFVHMALGETDLAFTCLRKTLDERSPFAVFLLAEPELDGLRKDPRFLPLLKRMRLAP
jgi:serine/threonine protein kinase/tetratricopeptide (TPR) repeat protein